MRNFQNLEILVFLALAKNGRILTPCAFVTDDITKSKAHIETLLLTNSYPMFVKHQMTKNVREALAKSKNEYHGLGDCFCITDPT
jgi:hypothetical protein